MDSINRRLKSAASEHWQVKQNVPGQHFVPELLGRRETGLPPVKNR